MNVFCPVIAAINIPTFVTASDIRLIKNVRIGATTFIIGAKAVAKEFLS